MLDIHSLQPRTRTSWPVNAIGRVQMEVQHALPVEPFEFNRVGGALIVVDPASHRTSGALLVDLPAAAPAEDRGLVNARSASSAPAPAPPT